MLSQNIKSLRKTKGLSQEELAVKLNVVRQTISKWEQGLSVPDADMLITLADVFEVPVASLLGEGTEGVREDSLSIIAEKLEVINLQLAKRKEDKRRTLHILFLCLSFVLILLTTILFFMHSPYLNWDYSDPETAVLGVLFHSFEWAFVRVSPVFIALCLFAAFLTRRKG